MKRLAVTVLFLASLLAGCATKNYVVHPGAFNIFDSQSYDTLVVTHSVIETTKADLVASKFPVSIAGGVKAALNGLIDAYDVADSSYLVYHAAAAAGTVTAAQQSAVSSAILNVNAATTNLTTAKVGN